MEVAELLIGRRSYREIGEKLFISIPTVKSHVTHIYQKMNVDSRGELLEVLQVAMDARNIPFATQNQLLARLAPMHRDVITAQ